MLIYGHQPGQLLLRALFGDGGEHPPDALFDELHLQHPVYGSWQLTYQGRTPGEPQAGGGFVGAGSSAVAQARRRTRYLQVLAEGPGRNWAESSMVQLYYVCANVLRVFVFSDRHGLVQTLCVGLGVEQHDKGRFPYSVVGSGVGRRASGVANIQHGSGLAIHQSRLHRCGGIGRGGSEHGRPRALDGQPVHRAFVIDSEVRGHLTSRLRRRVGGRSGLGKMVLALQRAAASPITGRCVAMGVVRFPTGPQGMSRELGNDEVVFLGCAEPKGWAHTRCQRQERFNGFHILLDY